jgi:hypothetical protein
MVITGSMAAITDAGKFAHQIENGMFRGLSIAGKCYFIGLAAAIVFTKAARLRSPVRIPAIWARISSLSRGELPFKGSPQTTAWKNSNDAGMNDDRPLVS